MGLWGAAIVIEKRQYLLLQLAIVNLLFSSPAFAVKIEQWKEVERDMAVQGSSNVGRDKFGNLIFLPAMPARTRAMEFQAESRQLNLLWESVCERNKRIQYLMKRYKMFWLPLDLVLYDRNSALIAGGAYYLPVVPNLGTISLGIDYDLMQMQSAVRPIARDLVHQFEKYIELRRDPESNPVLIAEARRNLALLAGDRAIEDMERELFLPEKSGQVLVK